MEKQKNTTTKILNQNKMMLSIAIILGLAMLLNIKQTEGNYNVLMAAALVVSLFALNIPLAIVILSILVLIGISNASQY